MALETDQGLLDHWDMKGVLWTINIMHTCPEVSQTLISSLVMLKLTDSLCGYWNVQTPEAMMLVSVHQCQN